MSFVFTNHESFDDLPTGSLPTGWTGSGWQVGTTNAISAPNSMIQPVYANGATLVWVGGGAEGSNGICAQFAQIVQLDANNHGASVGISLRTDSAGTTQGYYWLVDFSLGSNTAQGIYKRVSGTYTGINNFTTGVNWSNGDVAQIKVQASGTSLSIKVWKQGTTEPTTWNKTITDSSIGQGGYVGFYSLDNSASNGSTICAFDDVFVGTAGTATNVFPTQLVRSGTNNLYQSPFNWATINGQANCLLTINPGAELDLEVTGSTQIAMEVAVVNMAGAGFPAASFPKLKYSIDGGPMQTYQLQSTDKILNLGAISKSLQFYLMGLDVCDGNPGNFGTPLQTKWSGLNSLIIENIFVDAAATTSPYTPPPNGTWLAYGDSITEGEWQLGNSTNLANAVAYEDATTSHVALLANALGCQVCNIGFGGTDFVGTAQNDVPQLSSTYNFVFSGAARSFAVPPKYWSVNLGANNRTTGSGGIAAVVNVLGLIRAAVGSASQGYLFIPFGQQSASVIVSAYNQYIAANPSDNLKLINLNDSRYTYTGNGASEFLSDGLHPTQMAQAMIASQLVAAIFSGVTTVTQNTGGFNNLAAIVDGVPSAGVKIVAYLQSDYLAGNQVIQGTTVSDPTGGFSSASPTSKSQGLTLAKGNTYTLVYYLGNQQIYTKNISI